MGQLVLEVFQIDVRLERCALFTPHTLPVPEQMAAAGVQNIRRIQRELDRLGFNPGPADGSLGLKTTAAIKQYQRSRGLDPTGLVSEDLIQAMGIDTQGTVQ